MAQNLTRKILAAHLAKSSDMIPGEEIYLRVDQTLTHDINAVMTYLAFEAIGIDRIGVEKAVSYLDHNLLYLDFKTPDDHIYLQSAAERFGVHVSRPGNGICHAVQVSRFGAPGKLSMGGDSHTPHGGAIGMLCIGVGGMDIATAMTGVPMRLKMPRVIKVNLTGELRPGVNSKEVILEMLRRVTIKGGLGNVYEYVGPGAKTLEVAQRVTITNMGAEMGATTSIFPADEQVRKFMRSQGREDEFVEMLPDEGCEYDGEMEINLSELEPLIACPHQPDNVIPISEVEKKPVQQVFIGSCTNASYSDIAKAALVMQGHHVAETVSCTCAVSSKQIYRRLMEDGYAEMLLDAGVRFLEIACGPCCAIGQSPATKGVAVRTSNRNFKGRAGNPTAEIYLVSPESAAATAIVGTFATAEEIMGEDVKKLAEIKEPEMFKIDDSMIIKPLPPEEAKEVEIQERLVDAMCAKMLDPEFNKGIEVIVLPNLYGDIVTDVAAEHQGGLGTASSSNIGNKYAMFEAIHGTAPFLISHGRGQYADPCSLIRAVGMLVAHIGYGDRKQLLDRALDICTITERKLVVTTDKDGATAEEFTTYLVDTINGLK